MHKLRDVFGIAAAGTTATAILAVAAFLLTFPLALLTAWIRVELWDWFVVPYLHLPQVPVWGMFGIGILADTFLVRPERTRTEDAEDDSHEGKTGKWWVPFADRAIHAAFQLLALAVGYCVHVWFLK